MTTEQRVSEIELRAEKILNESTEWETNEPYDPDETLWLCKELRRWFTWQATEAIAKERDEALERLGQLEAARLGYASEFPRDKDGHHDVGRIHENIRKMKEEIQTWLVGNGLVDLPKLLRERNEENERLREEVQNWKHTAEILRKDAEKLKTAEEALKFYGNNEENWKRSEEAVRTGTTCLADDGGETARTALRGSE